MGKLRTDHDFVHRCQPGFPICVHLKLPHPVGCLKAIGANGTVLPMKDQAVTLVQKALDAIEVITPRYGCRGFGVMPRFGAKTVLLQTVAGRAGIRPRNY